MTIQYLSSNFITGLSSDSKPTSVPANSIFLETDTRTFFLFDGVSTWTQFAHASPVWTSLVIDTTEITSTLSISTGDVIDTTELTHTNSISTSVGIV